QYTVTNTSTGVAVPGHENVPYEAGKTVAFDGLSFEMKGLPQDGDQVVLAPSSGPTDLFSVVQRAVDALRLQGEGESAQRGQVLSQSLAEIDAGHDRVLLARGRAGEWLNRADSLDTLMNNRVVDFKTEQSRLEDLDLVKGISDFQSQQIALEAAIKAYGQVQRLSLFNVIN